MLALIASLSTSISVHQKKPLEYQHFLDDMSKGYPKLEVTYEFKNRIIMELRAYMVEIKEAERIGNKALAEQLWNNYRAERQYLIDAFGPINE
ncbi:hypothetical protein [Lysinibacillus irui]|uniref:Uncharacterized protein n=1 Tax=Lysinibacillus irui TaxID=2998077 RepID=A0AAJ5RHG8_9BACI|nr:hypothetical protein [Lysinibacillus irui]MEA0566257.1 hypothetical protein [Lysinibacillus irui]WDV05476.1 hypothetical protein OU989_14315 [Lysinibacillus irui]